MYILRPHAAGILYAPRFYTPPTPRRVILGVGGWACIKFGPVYHSLFFRSSSGEGLSELHGLMRGSLGTNPPHLTLESASPSPPKVSIWHRHRAKSGNR